MAHRNPANRTSNRNDSFWGVLFLSTLMMSALAGSMYSPEPATRTNDYEAQRVIQKYERAVRDKDQSSISRNLYRMETLLNDNSLPLSDKYRTRIEQIRNETTKR